MEQLTIASGRHQLHALYHRGTLDKGLLMIHGFALDLHELGVFDTIATALCEAGYHVLRYDLPGMGKSSGTLVDSSFEEMIQSVQDTFDWLQKKAHKSSILAASFGNACALTKLPQNCKAFISLNPTIFGNESWQHLFALAATKGWFTDYQEGRFVTLKSGLTVGAHLINALRDLNLPDYTKKIHVPFLLIHGTNDQYIPLEHAQKLYQELHDPKKLVVIEGARHGFRRVQETQKVIEESLLWLSKL